MEKKKVGRKSKFAEYVEPFLADIEKMALDMTEEQIAQNLGVSYRTFCEYKNKYSQLMQALKNGRTKLVRDLKSTLIKRAHGFTFEETKTFIENGIEIKKEVVQRYALPDVASINLLLKNYDKANWANDPQVLELRRKELDLKEKQIEQNNWEQA